MFAADRSQAQSGNENEEGDGLEELFHGDNLVV